jgi:ribosomal protein S10|nr:ribosomal protein S10 [Actinophrys sol]
MNYTKIQIKIESTDFAILQTKEYTLQHFCNIYNINYFLFYLPTKKKKITLLRSPHIHKKSWKTYIQKTFICKYTLYISDKEYILKLNTLFKTFTHCKITLKYLD